MNNRSTHFRRNGQALCRSLTCRPLRFVQRRRSLYKIGAKSRHGLQRGVQGMRTYLVVIDDSPESALALRFAGRRAAGTGGTVHIIATVEPQAFVAWGGVQATMEAEQRQQAEDAATAAAARLHQDCGIEPRISVRQGEAAAIIREIIQEEPETAALVLGAAASGAPGPLVEYFSGYDAGVLPVPLMIVPGSLTPEDIDRMS
jgi:nucleotide-binding universal stress UspA family protein